MIKQLYKALFSEKTRNDIVFLRKKVFAPFYFGDKYYCNCCNKSFRKFLSKGNNKRSNSECPYCGSLERTRLLHLFLKNETALFKKVPLKVLHIAPEMPLFHIIKRLNIEYIDGDINPAYARNVIDITQIHYPNNYFDLIICSHVLGHVPDEPKAISELRRVLKVDGMALLMTLINLNSEETFEDPKIVSAKDKLAFYSEPDLCRLHGLDFGKRLEKQGFVVNCIDYRQGFSNEFLLKNSLGDGQRELIFRCIKQ